MPLYALTCIAFRPSTNLKYEKKTRRSWSRRGEHSISKPPLPSKLGRSPLTLLQYPPQSGVCRRDPRPDSRRRKKPSATGAQIDDDRERFLKELKSQAFASHTQINAAATFRCVLEHQHSGATEPAAVCHSCYGEARQQADRLEAALHMDAKEAAKIVYEAVWADTSDPNTTYLNAATALLSELRNRAGIGLLLGANQPLP